MKPNFEIRAEEVIDRYDEPNNGSSPMWCYGSPTIVRDGAQVFASAPEVGEGVPPLCNTRWQLFRRPDDGAWERVNLNPDFNEREPCPLALLPGGRLILSVNPSIGEWAKLPDGRFRHHCAPQLFEFDAASPQEAPVADMPRWDREYEFSEHSYRSLAVDGETGGLLLLNSIEYDGQAWAYRDPAGEWSHRGFVRFPLRGCYCQVALRGRAAYIFAVSDIVEPNHDWLERKREITGQQWDFEFRQLYYTYTPDIASEDFSPILTVAFRDETAGLLRNQDMWIDADGQAHVVYTDRNVWYPFVRDKFFPDLPTQVALKYCRISDGKVTARRVLLECREDLAAPKLPYDVGDDRADLSRFPFEGELPLTAALYATADNRLFVVYSVNRAAADGALRPASYLQQIFPEPAGERVELPLAHPLTNMFAATVRNGTLPSNTIDLFGIGADRETVRYLSIGLGS